MSRIKRTSSQNSSRKEKKTKKHKTTTTTDEDTKKSSSTTDKWTLEELDLNKEIVSLYSLLEDKQLLVEKLFSILSSSEIKQMTPKALKDIPLSILKDICIIQLKDNAIVSEDEIMTTLIDAERVFATKYKNEPAVKPEEDNENEETVLDGLVKKDSEKPDEETTEPIKVEVAVTEQEKMVEKVEEPEPDDLSLPADFHMKLKQSYVQKGLCTLEDLDLDQPIIPLESMIDDREKLWDFVQKLVLTEELLEMLPQVLKGKPLDHVKNGIHEVICDLPKEVIEAVLNESNSSVSLNTQESSENLNLIKSHCSTTTEGVKNNLNEEVGGKENEEMNRMDEEGMEKNGSKDEEEDRKKNPCNDEDPVSKNGDEEKDAKERNPSGGEDGDQQKIRSSRLSPDEELAQLEKRAQSIREMLKAVEEEEARVRALKQKAEADQKQEIEMTLVTELDVSESQVKEDVEQEQQPDELQVVNRDEESSQENCDVQEGSSNASEEEFKPIMTGTEESDLLIVSRVADDDEDSIDRELKGLD